jgi:hypothetical protein
MPISMRLVFTALAMAASLSAQLDRGTVTGIVSDSSGATVPGAEVAVANTGTGATYRTQANHQGQYSVPNLPSGKYQAIFQAAGFKRLVRADLEIRATEVQRLDVTLEVGAVTDSIQVTGDVPRLETDSKEVSTTLENKELVNLPLTFKARAWPPRSLSPSLPEYSG